jgi:hypothetical protein
MGVGDLLTSFKGFFSRAFWLGAFLPVAIVAAVHAAIADAVVPVDVGAWVVTAVSSEPGTTVVAIAAILFLAYALAPITTIAGAILDGSVMPKRLHESLRRARFADWNAGAEAINAARIDYAQIQTLRGRLIERLQNARDVGAAKLQPDLAAIEAAETAVADLDAAVAQLIEGNEPDGGLAARLHRAAATVQVALEACSADEADDWSQRLDRTQTGFDAATLRIESEYRHRRDAAQSRAFLDDPVDWQPTRFGDARQLCDRFCRDSYGVPFSFLWPRVLLAMNGAGEADEDKGLPRTVVDGAAQVEFAVLLLALAVTVPAFWLPYIVIANKSLAAFVLIGVLAPAVLAALYELAVQSEVRFANSVNSAVDRYRLDVFPLLKLKPPPTRSAERALWRKLHNARVADSGVELVYHYPGATP